MVGKRKKKKKTLTSAKAAYRMFCVCARFVTVSFCSIHSRYTVSYMYESPLALLKEVNTFHKEGTIMNDELCCLCYVSQRE